MNKKELKKLWNKFWFIVWKDDSFKGWIISLIFLLIVIKGIFFPILNLVTGTSLPLVIVESCSMYHEDNLLSDFAPWWDSHDMKYFKFGLTQKDFLSFPFKKGFNKGDILFITKGTPENIEVGDIIIFDVNYKNPIIHRVIKITKENENYIFSTLGDNNQGQLSFETEISQNQIIGKAQANILPYVGWVKLIFFEHLKSPDQRGFCLEN